MALYLYDDARARSFAPFALTRPISELCAGALVTRRRWSRLCREAAAGAIAAPHLGEFVEFDAPPPAAGVMPRGSIVANSRCLPTGDRAPDADMWICGGKIAAVRLAAPLDVERLADGTLALESLAGPAATHQSLPGRWVERVWDYIRDLTTQLNEDIPALAGGLELQPAGEATIGSTVLGHHPVFVERGAVIEPYVVIDVTAGPVVIGRGAKLQAFTRIVGPCAIGPDSVVVADRIAASSIGERCRVHGELSTSVVLGHTNKSHDGFVGHSYLGRWVNLGAGTITSNLKNTYGPVQVWTPDGFRDTGMTFLGSLVGDYARTGIGTRLTTGSVIGAGANLFSTGVAPKVVPAFAWGDSEPFDSFALAKFLEVAERQMERRDVALGPGARAHLSSVHAQASRSSRAAASSGRDDGSGSR